MRPLSIRARLTIWYAGALLAILAVVSVLSYSVLRWSLLQQVDASLVTVAQIVRETDERGAGGSEVERAIRELLGPGFAEQFFQFLDPEGRSRFRSGPPHGGALPLSPEARENAARGRRTFETLEDRRGGPLRLLTVPVLRTGRSVEIIQVSAPLARTREALARYLTTLLALVPVAVALGAAGGAVLAGRALRPVREMSSAARQITAEDLGRRLARRGAEDEIDHLADTLNAMLAGLEAAFAQSKRFSADAAHELRTPLTALKGEMEVALRAARSPEEYRRVLDSSTRRYSSGERAARSATSSSPLSAVSGVRSSCAASAEKRRAWAKAASSPASMALSVSARWSISSFAPLRARRRPRSSALI